MQSASEDFILVCRQCLDGEGDSVTSDCEDELTVCTANLDLVQVSFTDDGQINTTEIRQLDDDGRGDYSGDAGIDKNADMLSTMNLSTAGGDACDGSADGAE